MDEGHEKNPPYLNVAERQEVQEGPKDLQNSNQEI